jgi:hypothetical protein
MNEGVKDARIGTMDSGSDGQAEFDNEEIEIRKDFSGNTGPDIQFMLNTILAEKNDKIPLGE